MKGRTGENLLVLLERRLDNVVYRLGFATSRAEARQLVRHGHFTVNGRKAAIPSMLLRAGDVVMLRERSREIVRITAALEALEGKSVPGWLDVDKANFAGSREAAAGPRRHHDADPGAAHRRAVLALVARISHLAQRRRTSMEKTTGNDCEELARADPPPRARDGHVRRRGLQEVRVRAARARVRAHARQRACGACCSRRCRAPRSRR
jgi:ribosomal 50S subunit-recycling heat shock protein